MHVQSNVLQSRELQIPSADSQVWTFGLYAIYRKDSKGDRCSSFAVSVCQCCIQQFSPFQAGVRSEHCFVQYKSPKNVGLVAEARCRTVTHTVWHDCRRCTHARALLCSVRLFSVRQEAVYPFDVSPVLRVEESPTASNKGRTVVEGGEAKRHATFNYQESDLVSIPAQQTKSRRSDRVAERCM